jgi:hypothetical protein
VGGHRHSLRPLNLIFPVLVVQVILLLVSFNFPADRSIPLFAAGNLVLAWVVIMQAYRKGKDAYESR